MEDTALSKSRPARRTGTERNSSGIMSFIHIKTGCRKTCRKDIQFGTLSGTASAQHRRHAPSQMRYQVSNLRIDTCSRGLKDSNLRPSGS